MKYFERIREFIELPAQIDFLRKHAGSIAFYAPDRVTIFLHPPAPLCCIMASAKTIRQAIKIAGMQIETAEMVAASNPRDSSTEARAE